MLGAVQKALKAAQQKKANIEAYSNQLSAVCHALQTGNFGKICCPPSWQALIEKNKNYKDVFQLILDYTYEKGTDYKVLESATDLKFSFFNAPDDDQAEMLRLRMREENLLANPRAYVATSL